MQEDQIVYCNVDILSGTPVFTGTRVPIQAFIDYLKAGDGLNDFLDGFPSVKREQVQALLDMAFTSVLGTKQNAHFVG
jgi:uncharacterized protein (DUF433 family)